MIGKDEYNFLATARAILELFTKWMKEEPFFSKVPKIYGQLWQF